MPRTSASKWKLQTKCCRAPIYFCIGVDGLSDGYFYHCGGCHRWLPLLRPEARVSAARPPEPPPKSYVRTARRSPVLATLDGVPAAELGSTKVRRVARERRS